MTFDWGGFAEVATLLKETGDGHAESNANRAQCAWRASVNRAYYAAYNLTLRRHREYWGVAPFRVEHAGVHMALLNSLSQKERTVDDPRAREAVGKIHAALQRLLEWRKKADYEDDAGITTYQAASALKRLDTIQQELGHLTRVR
jgi:hypothetical protein